MANSDQQQRRTSPLLKRVADVFRRINDFCRQLVFRARHPFRASHDASNRRAEFTINPIAQAGDINGSTQNISAALGARHRHITTEQLHGCERASWQSIYEQLQNGSLSVHTFLGRCSDRRDHAYERTLNDEAHTVWAREAASEAAVFLMPYLPQTKEELLCVIESLIDGIREISDIELRKKAKFAIDRLLRDNENDTTTQFKGRQLVIASWCYLNCLEGGANEAELNVFLLGLSAYIDSGDYPDAPCGDVSTGLSFNIGVFQGDEDVRSDKGLDPACYGRLRNICSCMMSIHYAVLANERMMVSESVSAEKIGKVINAQMSLWGRRSVSFLKIIKCKLKTLPNSLAHQLMVAFDDGCFNEAGGSEFIEWLKHHKMKKHALSLPIFLSAISGFEEMLGEQAAYSDLPVNVDYFKHAMLGMRMIKGIKHELRGDIGSNAELNVSVVMNMKG